MGRCTSRSIPRAPLGQSCSGDNNRKWVVGRYADASGVTHGLFFVPPNNFFTFDFPGSTFTSLNGISSQGNITGRYTDTSGIAHGFIARVRGTPPTKAAGPGMKPNSPSLRRFTQPVALGVGRCNAGALKVDHRGACPVGAW